MLLSCPRLHFYTAVSNALRSVCLFLVTGLFTNCTAVATITGVSYLFNEIIQIGKRNTDDFARDIENPEGVVAKTEETSCAEKREFP